MQNSIEIPSRGRKILLVGCLLVLTAGALLRLGHLSVPERTPDERAYTIYSALLAQNGPNALRDLVDEYNKTESMWVYPPPIRVGYLWLIAGVMKLSETSSSGTVAAVSCAASMAGLVVLCWVGWRFANPWVALLAVSIAAVSPMDLALARRAWQDEVFGCVALWLMALSLELAAKPGSNVLRIATGIVGCFCLLIKESAVVVCGLCYLWLAWAFLVRDRSPRAFLGLSATGLAIGVVALGLMAWASGGIADVWQVTRNNMSSVAGNEYAVRYQSGNWLTYWNALWVVSPGATILSLIGLGTVAASLGSGKRLVSLIPSKTVWIWLSAYFLAFLVVASIPKYLHNLRYVSPALGAFYLLAGIGAWKSWQWIAELGLRKARRVASIVVAGCTIAILVCDLLNFRTVFIKGQVPDLAYPLLSDHSIYTRGR